MKNRRSIAASPNESGAQTSERCCVLRKRDQPQHVRNGCRAPKTGEPEDLELSPFNQCGGLGKAHQLFGEQLPKLLDELNGVLAA